MQDRNTKIDDAIAEMKKADELITNYIYENEEQDMGLETIEAEFIKGKSVLHEKWLQYTHRYNAIEDTLIVLKKSLENERITLPEYIQQVRAITKTQFMCMAKKNKINTDIYQQ